MSSAVESDISRRIQFLLKLLDEEIQAKDLSSFQLQLRANFVQVFRESSQFPPELQIGL
eukprot:m.654478 g.654478  ORF g.654478 m.654478 type:complete len:59 (-) comp58412_c0_seq1:3322-3498(-)